MNDGKTRELFGIRVAAARLILSVWIEELVMEMKKKYTMTIVTHNMQQATRIWDNAAFSSRERWQGLVSPGGYSLCRVIKRMKITTQGDLDYDAQQV